MTREEATAAADADAVGGIEPRHRPYLINLPRPATSEAVWQSAMAGYESETAAALAQMGVQQE